MMTNTTSYREIRADFDCDTIVVYQAYNDAIADAALAAGRFVNPFSFGRMTWIKPSLLWLMERSGWATKTNQNRILAVRITRTAWDQAQRTIQVGIGRTLIEQFASEWIVSVTDMTSLVAKMRRLRRDGEYAKAKAHLPQEQVYPVSAQTSWRLGISAR